MASSLISEGLTLATSQLQALYTSLPPSLQAYIDTASQTIHRNLPHQLQRYSGAPREDTTSVLAKLDPTTVATVWVLPLLAVLFFMNRYWGSGGRHSPYTHAGGHPVRLTADDYEYVEDDGYDAPSRYRDNSYGFPSHGTTSHHTSKADTAGLDPDILIMKHKSTTYPLHFPAFDIAEGRLKVGDLRRVAADRTKTDDPRRIKLLYKGKSLRDDHRACKEENLKQNSEILCIVSAEPLRSDDGDESDSSSATSEMLANGFDDRSGPRVDVDGTIIDNREPRKRKGHRGGRKKRRDGRDSDRSSPRESASYLVPPGTNGTSSSSRNPSPSRRAPSPAPPKKPSSPAEALDMIASKFKTEFVPQCERFIDRPPSDAKAKDFEYKKLSEGILAQVILKLDEVQTDGDEELRARRKELVRETQSWLSDLDRAAKR